MSGSFYVAPTMRQRQQQTWQGEPFMGYNLWPRYVTQRYNEYSARRRAGDWGKLFTVVLIGLIFLLVSVLLLSTSSHPIVHAVVDFAALFVGSNKIIVMENGVQIPLTDELLDNMDPLVATELSKTIGRANERQMHSVVPDELLETIEPLARNTKPSKSIGRLNERSAVPDEPQTRDAKEAHPVCANGLLPGAREKDPAEEKEKASGARDSAQAEDLEKQRKDKERERRVRRGRVLLRERERSRRRERVLVGEGESELSNLTWAGSPRGANESACEAGLFYVYDLPEKFNVELVRECKKYHPDFCWKVEQKGLGPLLLPEDPACEKIPGTYSHLLGDLSSWYRTHQYSLESTYHARLMQHPCRTDDPQRALVFYLPFYVGLAFEVVDNKSDLAAMDELPNQFLTWLENQSYFRRNGGVDHFLAVGRGAFDFRATKERLYGSGFLNSPVLKNVTTLTFDQDLWDANMAGIPYPTFFHPSTDEQLHAWQQRIRNRPRRWRASFVGSKQRDLRAYALSADAFSFRAMIMGQCEAWDQCGVLDCKDLGNTPDKSPCLDPGPPMQLYLDSDFCLQPKGDTAPRKGVFDSMVSGCIPVFFHDDTAYNQYHWYLPMEKERYSVYMRMDNVRAGDISMVEILSSYSQSQIEEMRRVIIDEILPGIIILNPEYTGPRETKDAVSRAVDGMRVKMRRYNQGLNCDFPNPWMFANMPEIAYSHIRPATPKELSGAS